MSTGRDHRGRPSMPGRRPAVRPVALLVAVAAAAALLLPGARLGAQEAGEAGGDGLWELHPEVEVAGLESRKFGYHDYWNAVLPVVEGSGALEVDPIGRSAEGRTIRRIRFGDGPTSVLLWSQMHGDEATATMALADIFSFVADHPDHPLVERIGEGATVHFVPMLNPDGAVRFQRRNAQGIDINRDARLLRTPEGRTLRRIRERVQADFGFNLHDQNARTRVGETDRGVAIALLAPAFNEAREVNAVRERAIRLAAELVAVLEPHVGGHVARYDDTFNPRAFGDLMAKWGTSTILIESGGWEDDPQKQYLRRVNFVGILRALESIATGRYEDVPMTAYEELPENGRSVADLMVLGGTIAFPELPPLEAGLLIRYEDPLAGTGARIADIGDLSEAESRDTVRVDGAWIIPDETMLERRAGAVHLSPGAPASFTVARDREGRNPVWVFNGRGGVPERLREDGGG